MSDVNRPAHLTKYNAAAFQLSGVVAAYHLRTPYPSTLAPFLLSLARPASGPVLELGCGTGEITRRLAPRVERIDAIDVSAPMLARARTMPGGGHTAIRWIEAAAETAPFEGPYALAVAGDALHWMDWEVTLPRVAACLAPGAPLAIVTAVEAPQPWRADLLEMIKRYSVMRDFQQYDLAEELASRGLFVRAGEETLGAEPFLRSVDEYIDALHATAGLTRDRMGDEPGGSFDGEVRRLLQPFAIDDRLSLGASARIVWGVPAGARNADDMRRR